MFHVIYNLGDNENFTPSFYSVAGKWKSAPFKVAVHTCDVLRLENLIKTLRHASLTTSCIVILFNPIEVWPIAIFGH